MEPLPFDTSESHRFVVTNGATLDGKIRLGHSFDMGTSHPANQRFSHQAATLEDDSGKSKVGADGKRNDQNHLKSDEGHRDFINFFGN